MSLWTLQRWFGRRPLYCHGVLPGGADCPYVARGPFKYWLMTRHQRRVHR